MKSKKFLIVILLIGVCLLFAGCKLRDHVQMEESVLGEGYDRVVTLEFNGGSVNHYEYVKYYCKSGTKINELPSAWFPTRVGYEVIGWYIKPSADSDVADIDSWEIWDFNTDTVTEDVTLVARWRMLRSFSFGYYDFIAPEEGGEAVKTWVEVKSLYKGIDGTEFICGEVSQSDYTGMKNKFTGKTLLSGFNSEQPFYADEALTQELDLGSLAHPVTTESDLSEDMSNVVYRIYCKYLEGTWTILDSESKVSLGNGNYYLVDDVTLKTENLYINNDMERDDFTVFNPSLRFTGTIKGNGHKIIFKEPLQPVYQRQSTLFIGFFGVLDGATIEDVTFEGMNMNIALPSGSNESIRFGFLAGNIINSTLKNVTLSGTLTIENTEGNNGIRELINSDVWFGQKDEATVVEGCNFDIDVTDNRQSKT